MAKARGEAAAEALRGYIEAMKSSGFVAATLARHGIRGAVVAPPTGPGAGRGAGLPLRPAETP